MSDIRDKETKDAFIKYLSEHPELRLWQAIRNFSGYGFIYASNEFLSYDVEDTFYWEGEQ